MKIEEHSVATGTCCHYVVGTKLPQVGWDPSIPERSGMRSPCLFLSAVAPRDSACDIAFCYGSKQAKLK